MTKKIGIILLYVCLSVVAFAQSDSLSVAERNALQGFNDTIDRLAEDFVTVSLVVCDPGEVLYSTLGHAALHLQCPTFGLDYIFSYESEDIEGKVLRFLTNDLKMGMMAIEPDEFMKYYINEQREVKEFILNLPVEVKSELWRMCDERMKQGMLLEYDPVKRGCAISVVHSVEDAIQSANRMFDKSYRIDYPQWGRAFNGTLREIFYNNAPYDWGLFWCMTIVGGIVDEPNLPHKEKLICPAQLVQTWMQSSIDGKMLINEPAKILNEGIVKSRGVFTPLAVSILVLIVAIISFFLKIPYFDWLILIGQTLLGCLMIWLLLSPLPATGWNWLIVPFNILPALGWYWRRYWSLPYALMILVWCVAMAGQFVWGHVLVDWAHIVLALSFAVVLFKQWYTARKAE